VWAWWPADFARMAMLPLLPLGSTGTVTMPSSRTHGSLIWPWIAIACRRSVRGTAIGTPAARSDAISFHDRYRHPGIVFRDIVAVSAPCAARAEQIVAARTANSRRWHGMPRAIAVDAVLRELATGSTSID